MKSRFSHKELWSAIGLAALLAYVLACTSFSPDDSKVLYPSVDLKTGATGVSVYDRKSGQSELLFVPTAHDTLKAPEEQRPEPGLIRTGWLADGRGAVAIWGDKKGSGENSKLNFAVIPIGERGPTRVFALPGMGDENALSIPPAIVGSRWFVGSKEDDQPRVNWMDLKSGTFQQQLLTNAWKQFALYSAGSSLFYFAQQTNSETQLEFGRINPDTLQTKLLMTVEAPKSDIALAFSPDGQQVAVVRQDNGELNVWREGKLAIKRMLGDKDAPLRIGNALFSPKGDFIVASFQTKPNDEKKSDFGFVEVSLNNGPLRKTILLKDIISDSSDSAALFQLDLSHDGKTVAMASTYLAMDEDRPVKPEDCALFLVDLGSPPK